MANMLDLAIAQLIGFKHGKKGFSLIDLITGMGLKEREWETIKADHPISFLSQTDISEIDNYFKSI